MCICTYSFFFFFSSRRRHTRLTCDWSSDVCSSDLRRGHACCDVPRRGARRRCDRHGPAQAFALPRRGSGRAARGQGAQGLAHIERAARTLHARAFRPYLPVDIGLGLGAVGRDLREHGRQPRLAIDSNNTEEGGAMKSRNLVALAAASGLALAAAGAFAQTIKIGFITSYSGLNGNLGPYMERGARLYLKEHQKELPPGVNIEFLIRDDTGPNPDKAKQLAQELIVRDKVNLLAGVIFTPNALAMAPLVTEAKVPFIIMNAGTAVITTRSPYIARLSFTLWQSCYPLGQWAAKRFKRPYTMVSDFGPGHDCEDAFVRASKEAFVAAWKRDYGANETPNFVAVGGWDGMAAIMHAIREQKGKLDPDRTMELLKSFKDANSPRGPISIDPATRDIVQNEYLREVRRVGGRLANVEIETVGTAVKDPWKELNKK